MDNLAFSLEDLYVEVKERALSEGALSREEWDDLVETVLDEKREFEEINDDDDWGEMRESLQARYDDFRSEVPEM